MAELSGFADRVRAALSDDDPTVPIRAIVIEYRESGVSVEDLLKAMGALVMETRERDREDEEDALLDVMDMLAGWSRPGTRIV
jgi:hypothetical protein